MKRKNSFILYTSLSVLWTGFIFSNSLKTADISGEVSGGVLNSINSILSSLPGSPSLTEHFLRKAAHFTEFWVLGILLTLLAAGLLWKFKYALPFILSFAVACTDETIQLFVEGRSGQFSDVLIDLAGAAAGFVTVLAIKHLFISIRNSHK